MDEIKKFCAIAILALLFAIVAYSSIQSPDIAFEIVQNNTDIGYGSMNTGNNERQPFVAYYANDSALDVYLIAHIVGTGGRQAIEFNASINGTVVQETTRDRTLQTGLHEHFPMNFRVPKGASYMVKNSSVIFNMEWREYKIISGRNGSTLVNNTITNINQTIINNFTNITGGVSDLSNLNASNLTSGKVPYQRLNVSLCNPANQVSTFNQNTLNFDCVSNTDNDPYVLITDFDKKVNKSGDTMTGQLIINNNSAASLYVTTQNQVAVEGVSDDAGIGVYGFSPSGTGLFGYSTSGNAAALYGKVYLDNLSASSFVCSDGSKFLISCSGDNNKVNKTGDIMTGGLEFDVSTIATNYFVNISQDSPVGVSLSGFQIEQTNASGNSRSLFRVASGNNTLSTSDPGWAVAIFSNTYSGTPGLIRLTGFNTPETRLGVSNSNGYAQGNTTIYTAIGFTSTEKVRIDGTGNVYLNTYNGVGNAYACFDSNGMLFRSAVACV